MKFYDETKPLYIETNAPKMKHQTTAYVNQLYL